MIGTIRIRRRLLCAGVAMVAIVLVPASPCRALASGGALPDLPLETQQLLQRAQREAWSSHYSAAADSFRRANEAAGGKCLPCARQLAFLPSGHLDEAIEATRAAVHLLAGDPRLGHAYSQLGDLLLVRRDAPAATEAEQAYQQAVDLGPAFSAEALAGLARARLRLKHYREAAAAALQLLQVVPNGPVAGNARSTICTARMHGVSVDDAPMPPVISSAPAAGPAGESDLPPAGAEPFRIGGEVTKPTKLGGPEPVYTEMARKARLQGVVILEAIIDRDGCVTRPHVLKGMPMGLERSALSALSRWAFAPATLHGHPVKVFYTLTVNFSIGMPPVPEPDDGLED